ncbi:MAG: NADH-quinone oxidoreductase subunit N [Rickettsia sp.]|nr:NADH-quinone oxidoreductase subunit N [Rickettsia sp.]
MEYLIALFPEIFLLTCSILGQSLLLFYRSCTKYILLVFSVLILITSLISFNIDYSLQKNILFNNSFYINDIIFKIKIFIMFIVGIILFIFYYTKLDLKNEYFLIIIFAAIGALIAISSKDLLLLFCALELQSLSSYAMVSLNKNISNSSEAAIKYFIMGSFFTCFMLLGTSFIYGFSGHLNFFEISNFLQNNEMINLGFMLGLFFLLFSIFFKLSAAPFHFWSPDVYLTSDISSFLYFGTVTKISLSIALANIVQYLIFNLDNAIYSQITKIFAIFSMILGAFISINQIFIKRLMAYLGILNIGYYLITVSIFTYEAQNIALFFILNYSISFLGLFLCMIFIFGKNIEYLSFHDLIQIGYSHRFTSILILINIFSMLGIPPFLGFFMKYNILYSALKNGEISIACIAILMTVISGYIYLKIISYMYFIKNKQSKNILTQNSDDSIIIKYIFYTFILLSTLSLILLPIASYFVNFNIFSKFLF